jgi:hypothetical protein
MPEQPSGPGPHEGEQPQPTFEATDNLAPFRATARELIEKSREGLRQSAQPREPEGSADNDPPAVHIPHVDVLGRLIGLIHEQPDIPDAQLEDIAATWLFEADLRDRPRREALAQREQRHAAEKHDMIATPDARANAVGHDLEILQAFMESQGAGLSPIGRNAIALAMREMRDNPTRDLSEIVGRDQP